MMEKHLDRVMDDIMNTKNVTGCAFADHQGLCLGVKGNASLENTGILVALMDEAAKLEKRLPILVLENDQRSCIIQRSGTVTGAIYKNNTNTQ